MYFPEKRPPFGFLCATIEPTPKRKGVILLSEYLLVLWTTLLAPALLTCLKWYLDSRSKK